MLHFDASANGQAVELPVDQGFEITLAEIATTGFRWRVQSNGEPACALLEDTFDPPPVKPPNQPGNHHWHFQAVQMGSGDIRLVYQRSWEQTKPPAQTFTLHVQVLA